MKPLRLELEGFTCYRSRQVISFDGLELFAISGPTGAGKSMLLDAITYGLYGQTARLGRINLDTLISPGEERLEVDLQFQVAAGVYRVVRTAERRASGNVVKNTRVLQLDDAGGWQQLPESERLRDADLKLGEIIGLDYDGFTRSVLLPQGAFDEFLKGDATKRRNLLVSLLNLERIEQMRGEASSRHSAANALVQQLTASLDGDYASATPQLVRELSDRLAELQLARDTGGRKLLELEEKLEQLAELERHSSELAEVQRRHAELLDQAGQMESLAREEEQGRRALALTPLLAQHQQRSAALGKLEREAEQAAGRLAELEPRAAAARTTAGQAAEQLQREEPLQLERIASLKTVEPLSTTLTRLGGSLALAGTGVNGDAFSQEAVGQLRELQAQIPALQRTTREQEQAAGQLAAAQAARQETRRQAELASAAVEDVTVRGKAARSSEKQAQAALQAAEVADQALALRQHVHAGADCPVCGQLVVELPSSPPSQLAQLQQEVAAASKVVAELREEYSRAAARQATALERQAQAERSAGEAAGRLASAVAALQEALQPFSAAGRSGTPAELAATLKEEYAQQLAALASQIVALTGNEDPVLALNSAEARLASLRQERSEAERMLSGAEQELAESRLRHTLQLETLGALREEAAELAAALQGGLQAAGFSDEAGLHAAVRSEEQLAAARQRLQEHAHELKLLAGRRSQLESLLDGRSYQAEEHAQLRQDRTALQKQLAGLNEQAGRCSAELETARQRLEAARQQRKDRDEAQLAFDTWWQLDRDLRGSAFVTYLLSQVQQRLASRASVIIRQVTDGRYDLHLAGHDEYQISDAWTPGGERRSVKSLSGGETFIVSLALALALSDTIAGGQALGALFLDEGFGTLDAATLESVTQVLETLTQAGRMVGIITHVTELTERLPARLVVRKGPAGSHVRWDE